MDSNVSSSSFPEKEESERPVLAPTNPHKTKKNWRKVPVGKNDFYSTGNNLIYQLLLLCNLGDHKDSSPAPGNKHFNR